VRATWFVTHASPAIDRLRARPDLFELGIHPNFHPGSTHGDDVAGVLAHCLALVPEARVMRAHGLVGSSRLFTEVVQRTPIRIDSTLLLRRHAGLAPVTQPLEGGALLRMPIWWEDDVEQLADDPDWTPAADAPPGLRILNFHPIHVALNGATPAPYAALRAEQPALPAVTAPQVARHRASGPGPGTAFAGVVDALAAIGGGPTLSMLAATARRAPTPLRAAA
jgi:hypothetical protein